jgi:hypothetical protein
MLTDSPSAPTPITFIRLSLTVYAWVTPLPKSLSTTWTRFRRPPNPQWTPWRRSWSFRDPPEIHLHPRLRCRRHQDGRPDVRSAHIRPHWCSRQQIRICCCSGGYYSGLQGRAAELRRTRYVTPQTCRGSAIRKVNLNRRSSGYHDRNSYCGEVQ